MYFFLWVIPAALAIIAIVKKIPCQEAKREGHLWRVEIFYDRSIHLNTHTHSMLFILAEIYNKYT